MPRNFSKSYLICVLAIIITCALIWKFIWTSEQVNITEKYPFNDFTSKSRPDIQSPMKKRRTDIKLWTKGQVITRNQSSWNVMNKSICARTKDFILGHIKAKKYIPIFLHPADDDIHISRVLLNGGSWEEELLKKVVRIMERFPESIFIDVGAHVGVYSLAVASRSYKVIAVDCYSGNVGRLCASTKAGKLWNKISIIYNAISDTRRDVIVKQSQESNIGSNAVVSIPTQFAKTFNNPVDTVQAIMLNDLLEIFNIQSAVLKIDVEGHEHNVLKGGERFFKQVNVHFVLMEFNFHRNRDSGKYIVEFLDRHQLQPDLPDDISRSNQTQWPWNIQWIKEKQD